MKTIAIIQSNYIPWRGYFDIIGMVDEFIVYDNVQFTKNDWRNRNKIKTPAGTQWITIPVNQKGHLSKTIKEITVSNGTWASQHWKILRLNYARAPYFKDYSDRFEALYNKCEKMAFLSEINMLFIKEILDILAIKCKISDSSEYEIHGDRVERLIDLCHQSGATTYISGPAAKDYLNEDLFRENNIRLVYKSYDYPEYPQLWGSFEGAVSVLDLLFNTGTNARNYLKSRTPNEVAIP